MVAKTKRRSPLRARPLPQAGQALDRRLDDIFTDDIFPWLMVAGFACVMAIVAWIYFLRAEPPNPWPFTIVAAVAVPAAYYRLRRQLERARRIKLGRDGERIVAETLQELVQRGWRVFHDIPAHGFNIDHVAIGPGGILAIETKTFGKLPEGVSEIVVSDAGISIEGRKPNMAILDQATQQANWLRNELRHRSGSKHSVRPVIVFTGWFVRDSRRRKEPWVLERKALPAWVAREPVRLDAAQIRSTAQCLDDFVRLALERAEIARGAT